MKTVLFPSVSRLAMIFAKETCRQTPRDLTEPGLCPDVMGTVCAVHGCERFLGEAALVPREREDGEFDVLKQRRFPNSWTAIASHEQPRAFRRTRRRRLVVVRYCPKCRETAQACLEGREARAALG